jgi:chemotaxis protein CheX
MKAEHINPFVESSIRILKEAACINASLGKIFIRQNYFTVDDIVIIIGITGELKGQAVFSVNKMACEYIASLMMKQLSGVEDASGLSISAIAELSNQILGNTINLFYKLGIAINITPPTILEGVEMQLQSKPNAICIPLSLDNKHNFEINISITNSDEQ